MKRNLIIVVFIQIISFISLYPQSFNLYSIDTSNFPQMRAMFYARTPMGVDYPNITVTDFDLYENGQLMNSTLGIDCKKVNFFPQLAVVLVLDISTSMNADAGDGKRRIDWVKRGAFAFLDSIKLDPPSVMAFILFAGDVYKTSPLYDSKQPLYDWLNINLTIAAGSTDFYPPFVRNFPPLGALPLLETAPKDLRRVVIFLTDGEPERPFLRWKVDTVTAYAKRIKAQVYSIFITSPMNPDIDYICQQTAGKSFSVFTEQELINAFKKIVGDVQSRYVCYLTWISPFGCDEASKFRSIKAIFKRIPDSVQTSYFAPENSIAKLEVSDDILLFGAPGVGTTTRSLTFSAKNSDFNITGYDFVPNSFKFTVDWKGKTPPFVLPKDEKHTIEIAYIESPPSSSSQTNFNIISSPCTPPPVVLVAPCGGEYTKRIDFGNVPIQSTKPLVDNCVFRNTTAVEISGVITIDGPDKDDFRITTGSGGFTLKPDECLSIVVEFLPKTVGNKSAFLKFNIPNYCGDFQTELFGKGIPSSLPIPTLNFNVRRVLTLNDTSWVVYNHNPASITITSASVSIPNDPNYQITLPTNFPIKLNPGDSFSVDVRFIPQDEGLHENAILFVLEESSEPAEARITGIGGLPKILASDVNCGSTSISVPVLANLLITNPSQTMDLFVEDVIMQSNPDFRFSTGATTSNFIVPKNGGTYSIPIEFIPTKTGLLTVPILIITDAASGPNPKPRVNDTVLARGIGLGLIVSPNPFVFDNISACAIKELTFTIDNSYFDTENNITNVEIKGIDKDYFVITDYTRTLAPHSKGFIKVHFNPEVGKTNYRADLSIKSDLGDLIVPIQGSVFTENLFPQFKLKSKSISVSNTLDLVFSIDIKNHHSIPITKVEFNVKLNKKSLVAKYFTSDLPNWNWEIQTTTDGYLVEGTAPPFSFLSTPINANFIMKFDTYLSDEYKVSISITPTFFEAVDCLIPTTENEEIILATCFTPGRPIIISQKPFQLNEISTNPVSDNFDISFSLAFDGRVDLKIYNVLGDLVETIVEGYLSRGNYSFYIPINKFSKGTYFVKLTTDGLTQIRSFILMK
ncbi:MAG: choice-of-anchor D domain-containing protein [Candidatus Kapaibacteriales bacterium]